MTIGLAAAVGVAVLGLARIGWTVWRRRRSSSVSPDVLAIDAARRETLRQIAASDYQRRHAAQRRGSTGGT